MYVLRLIACLIFFSSCESYLSIDEQSIVSPKPNKTIVSERMDSSSEFTEKGRIDIYNHFYKFESDIYQEAFLCINQPPKVLKELNFRIKLILSSHLVSKDFRIKICEVAILLSQYLQSNNLNDQLPKHGHSIRAFSCLGLLAKINAYMGSMDSLKKTIVGLSEETRLSSLNQNFSDFFASNYPSAVNFNKNSIPYLKDESAIALFKRVEKKWKRKHEYIALNDFSKTSLEDPSKVFHFESDFNDALSLDAEDNHENRLKCYETILILNRLGDYRNRKPSEELFSSSSFTHILNQPLEKGVVYNQSSFSVFKAPNSRDQKIKVKLTHAYFMDSENIYGRSNVPPSIWLVLPNSSFKYLGINNKVHEFEQVFTLGKKF